MWEPAITAAERLFSVGPILGMVAVLPIALISGLMPGGGLPVTVIVFSMIGFLDPWVAITVVIFHKAAGDITEPVSSILLGIPGSRSAQATILDGYPMARQGLAGVALGASYTSSLIGGLIGALALLVSLPIARDLLQYFGSPEFFLLSLIGVLAVAVVSAGAFAKGMLTAALGLAISTIGYSPVAGVVRTDFGIADLFEGIPLVPLVVGLFAIPEAIALVVSNQPIAAQRMEEMLRESRRDVLRGMGLALKHKWLILRSSMIGTFVGMLPGVGGSVAHWIAYAQARQTERGATETFGRGDVRGVIAPEAANNSSDGGDLIPTIMFGIPGSGGMVIVLAMLILYGMNPGPQMLNQHLPFTISLVYTIALANIIVVPIVLAFSPTIIRMAAIPPNALAPVIIALVTMAAFQAANSLSGLLFVLGFGVLGVFMKSYGWPRPPILIAVVLGKTLEQYLWLSTQTFGWSMLLRPQFLIMLGLTVLTITWTVRMQRRTEEMASAALANADRGDKLGKGTAL